MKKLPKISDAEWQILKELWSNSPVTANKIIENLSNHSNWKPRTIKTLISRLVKKGAVGYEIDKKDNRTYHYFPLVDKEQCVKAESQSFLKKVYNGSFNMMVAKLIEEQELSQQEIDELKQILNQKKSERDEK